MRNRPDAVELIEIAEKTLTGDVAPDLTPRKRYSVALIAAAMGIAKRELKGGPTAWPGEMAAMQEMYGTAGGPTAGKQNDPGDALAALNRRFAADLRAGLYDEPGKRRTAAMTLLRNDVVARLTEDSPRYEK